MENYVLRRYGVIFKYYKEEADFTQIHFEVEVTYKGQSQSGNYHFIINRKKVFIDQMAPDLIIEQLAEKAGSCLYPMEIITSQEGPFQEIANYEEIKKRWDDKKIELEHYYVGEISKNIIERVNVMYSSKMALENAVREDLFLKLFFMPIYRKHVNLKADYQIACSFIPFASPTNFRILQEVSPFLTRSKKQIINLKGVGTGFSREQPNFELNYKLSNETKSVFSIVGEIDVAMQDETTRQINIEIYELAEK